MAAQAPEGATIVVRVTNHAYWMKSFKDGSWSDYEEFMPGPWVSEPLSVSRPGKLSVIGVFKDNSLQIKQRVGTSWSSIINLGGICRGLPAACSLSDGTLDIFHIGIDLGLYHIPLKENAPLTFPLNFTKIVPSESSDGVDKFIHSPAVAYGNGISLFAVGINSALYQITGPLSGWGPLWKLPLSLQWVGSPKVCWIQGRFYIFCIDSNSKLRCIHVYGPSCNIWHTFLGSWISDPEVISRGTNRIDIFMRGLDNSVYHAYWKSNTWSEWTSLGGECMTTPKVAVWDPDLNRIDLIITDSESALLHKWMDKNGEWHPSTLEWNSLGGSVTSRAC